MDGIYPNCVVYPDDDEQWVLYVDQSCQEIIGIFPEREDAEDAQRFFSKGR